MNHDPGDRHPLDEPDPRGRYRLCRAGLAFNALGLAMLAVHNAAGLAVNLRIGEELGLRRVVNSHEWIAFFTTGITWSLLIGPYLLLGRWAEPHWRRRIGLLLMIGFLKIGTWLASNAVYFGLARVEPPHEWLRMQFIIGIGYIQFGLLAALAADVASHLGARLNPEGLRRARVLVALGMILWAVGLLNHTDWARGWPLMPIGFGPRNIFQIILLSLAIFLTRTLCALQGMLLSLVAIRECSGYLRELDVAEALGHRAGPDLGLDALKTRSTGFDDDRW